MKKNSYNLIQILIQNLIPALTSRPGDHWWPLRLLILCHIHLLLLDKPLLLNHQLLLKLLLLKLKLPLLSLPVLLLLLHLSPLLRGGQFRTFDATCLVEVAHDAVELTEKLLKIDVSHSGRKKEKKRKKRNERIDERIDERIELDMKE